MVSCSRRKSFDAEEYLQIQKSYELEKISYSEGQQEANKTKQELFDENRIALIDLIYLVEKLAVTKFDQVNNDTTYFKNDVTMNPVNFGSRNRYMNKSRNQGKSNGALSNVIFLNGDHENGSNGIGSSYLEKIKSCLFLKEGDFDCLNEIEYHKIKEVMSLEYAFIITEQIRIEPELKGNEFNGGIYAANVICYDLKEKDAIFSFFVISKSSDEVQTSSGAFARSPKDQLLFDFNRNIKKGIFDSCKKHFQFVDGLSI